MEEKIFEILAKTLRYMNHDRKRTAKEITAHVFEFIEWLTSFRNEYIGRCGKGWRISNIKSDEPYKEYSIKKVYYYWLTEVKK